MPHLSCQDLAAAGQRVGIRRVDLQRTVVILERAIGLPQAQKDVRPIGVQVSIRGIRGDRPVISRKRLYLPLQLA
jgi:hypothetical protein